MLEEIDLKYFCSPAVVLRRSTVFRDGEIAVGILRGRVEFKIFAHHALHLAVNYKSITEVINDESAWLNGHIGGVGHDLDGGHRCT